MWGAIETQTQKLAKRVILVCKKAKLSSMFAPLSYTNQFILIGQVWWFLLVLDLQKFVTQGLNFGDQNFGHTWRSLHHLFSRVWLRPIFLKPSEKSINMRTFSKWWLESCVQWIGMPNHLRGGVALNPQQKGIWKMGGTSIPDTEFSRGGQNSYLSAHNTAVKSFIQTPNWCFARFWWHKFGVFRRARDPQQRVPYFVCTLSRLAEYARFGLQTKRSMMSILCWFTRPSAETKRRDCQDSGTMNFFRKWSTFHTFLNRKWTSRCFVCPTQLIVFHSLSEQQQISQASGISVLWF